MQIFDNRIFNNEFVYHFKTSKHRYLSFLFSACILALIFYFFVPSTITNFSTYSQLTKSSFDEVWFTSIADEGDCYLSLNGQTFVTKEGEKNLSVDIFMQLDSSNYDEDFFAVNEPINPGECVISKNVAKDYGINVGDKLSCKLYSDGFVVTGIIDAYEGIDDKYLHEGICLIGYSSSLIPPENAHYVTFTANADGIFGLERVIFLKNRITTIRDTITKNAIMFVCSCLLMTLFEEIFIYRKRKFDYKKDLDTGKNKTSVFGNLVLDSIIKYCLPFAIGMLVLMSYFDIYTAGYVFVLLGGLVMMSIASLCNSIIYFLEVSHGK